MAQKKDAPPPEKPSRGLAARAPARAARKTGPKTGPKTGTRASPKPPAPGSVGSPRGRSGPRAGLGKAGLGKAAPEAGLLMIGCGKMGQALLDRWLVAGRIQAKFPATIVDPQRFSALAAPRKAVRAFAALEDIPAQRKFDTVLLAVKPSDYEKTCLELRAWLVERHARSKATPPSLLISVMAGIGTSLLQAVFEAPVSLPDAASGSAGAPDQSSSPGLSPGLSSGLSPSFFTGLSIVRAMPNLPVAIGHGLTFLCPSGRCRKGALRRATTLFQGDGSDHSVGTGKRDERGHGDFGFGAGLYLFIHRIAGGSQLLFGSARGYGVAGRASDFRGRSSAARGFGPDAAAIASGCHLPGGGDRGGSGCSDGRAPRHAGSCSARRHSCPRPRPRVGNPALRDAAARGADLPLRAQFLEAMSLAVHSVYVLTSGGEGLTLSAFSSLAVDGPQPTILACVHRQSPAQREARVRCSFAVNLLGAPQRTVAEKFAGWGGVRSGQEKFAAARWSSFQSGNVYMPEALMALDCQLRTYHRLDTHIVLIGSVREVYLSEAVSDSDPGAATASSSSRGSCEPLTYARRQFQAPAPSPE